MTEKPTQDKVEELHAQLEMIVSQLKEMVKEHGAFMVAGAYQALKLDDFELSRASAEAGMMALARIRQSARAAAEMCQCEECKAGRAQA